MADETRVDRDRDKDRDRDRDRDAIIHSAAEAMRVLAQAADAASERLAGAANDATKVVANAASEAVKVSFTRSTDDHDLLIKIDTQVKGLKDDIKDLKDGTTIKIADHEKRIGCLEVSQSLISGAHQGIKDVWGWIVGGIMTVIALASFILPRLK
jgi:broad-specificity NMP kinase